MFLFLQAYVGLRDDDPFNIWLEEKHLEQLLDCWLHVCVEAEACLVFATSSKTAIAVPRMHLSYRPWPSFDQLLQSYSG